MLGQSGKEHIIQKHIRKLIPGIHKLGVKGEKAITITSVCSAADEVVLLQKAIEIGGPIEQWLNRLMLEIRSTLKQLIVKCSQHDRFTEDLLMKYPMQVLCLVRDIQFTKSTEKAITSMTLQAHLQSFKQEIECFTALARNDDNLLRIKVRALLMGLVHYVTVVETLIEQNVTSCDDWFWLQQIKFYVSNQQMVVIRMVYAEFEYGFEYLGNYNKLVDTKLTHNCYLTLTQAMHLGLGGNPFGPAGTGKTECVKSLGAMLGRLVLVFNCNEVSGL